MEQDDIIEVYQEQTKGENDCIKLKVIGQDSNEIHFLVKMSTNLGKLKKSYAEKVEVPVSSLKFFFDGRHINNDESPKGGLISEGILTLVPLPKISAKSHPWAERLNFLAFSANNLGIQIFCSGARFGTFFGEVNQNNEKLS